MNNMRLNIGTLVGIFLVTGALAVAFRHDAWTPLRIAGVVIGVPSLAFFVLARLQLGNAFTPEAEATTLVTRGLYARIQHPIYVFSLLFLTGVFLFIERPQLLIALVLIIPIQVMRAREESAVLAEKFGKEYAEYKARTWF